MALFPQAAVGVASRLTSACLSLCILGHSRVYVGGLRSQLPYVHHLQYHMQPIPQSRIDAVHLS